MHVLKIYRNILSKGPFKIDILRVKLISPCCFEIMVLYHFPNIHRHQKLGGQGSHIPPPNTAHT